MSNNYTRSFTHPLSNTVVFDKIDLSKHLGDVLLGALPLKYLPVFLHEATHHWCFNSPVGFALSLISLNNRDRLMKFGWDDSDKEDYLATNEIRYQTAFSILAPILEGLSEFAEFDALPGKSKILSMPSFTAALFFFGKMNLGEKLLDTYSRVLREYRLDPEYIDRKISLLSHSVDARNSSYLSGYLFVKSQFNAVRSKYEAFHDADFFMHYYRCYLFDDWKLVRLLLDEEIDPGFAATSLLEYLSNRIYNFIDIDHSDFIIQFEENVLKKNITSFQIKNKWLYGDLTSVPVDNIGVDEETEKLLTNRIDEVLNFDPGGSDIVSYIVQSIFSYRGVLSLGSVTLKGKVTKNGWLSIYSLDGMPLLARKAPPKIETDWEDLIDADVIFTVEPFAVYTIITKNNHPLAGLTLGNNEIDENTLYYFLNRGAVLDSISIMEDAFAGFKNTEFYKIYQNHSEELIDETINQFYRHGAFIYTDDTLFKKAFDLMSEEGFRSLFNDDDLLHDCVLASIISSNQLDAYRFDKLNTWKNGTAKSAIKKINPIIKEHLGFTNFKYVESEKHGIILSYLL